MGAGCNIDWGCFSGQLIQEYYTGDTLIDGLAYKIIHEAVSPVSSGCCSVPLGIGPGYLRDDTAAHKVYWRIPGTSSDSLLYDFTLEEGDTLRGLYANTGLCAEGVVTVISIDSVQVGNSYRRRLNLLNDPCFGPSIIEGIGSTTGLTSCYFMNKSFGIILNCFTVNGELMYEKPCGAPDLLACGNLPLEIVPITTAPAQKLTINPNPSTGHFYLGQAVRQVTVYSAQGRLLFTAHGKEVDLSSQQPGVYTAVVATERGRQAVRLVVVR